MSDDDTGERGTVYDGRSKRIVRFLREIRAIVSEAFLLVCVFAGVVGLALIIARAITR